MFRSALLFISIAFTLNSVALAQGVETPVTVPMNHPPADGVIAINEYLDALKTIKPRTDRRPLTAVTKDGFTIVTGDVFHNGQAVALISQETGGMGFAFARWQGKAWKIVNLFHIWVTSRPVGWKVGEDYLPIAPATKPFWLQDFSGDGIPEVVVAGEVNKYYQLHYLLRYRSKLGHLSLVGHAMRAPELQGSYVIFYDNSGRRAIWEEWHYCQWVGDDLIERGSWHDESPNNNIDPPFVIGTRTDAHGVQHSFRATSPADNAAEYTITRDDKPFVKVTLDWSKTPLASSAPDSEYFFQRFTGLPRALFTMPDAETTAEAQINPRVTVHGSGVEAAAMFGVKLTP